MIRQSFRRLIQAPLPLLAALAAFALGIGVNTAMYSICDALIFHPVELRQLDRLLLLEAFSRGAQEGIFDTSPADFDDFRRGLAGKAELGFSEWWDVTITRDGEPEQVDAARVSANWLELTGMHLRSGRGFLPGEDAPGKNRVAVLTEGLAERRFGGTAVLGRAIRLNNEDYTIVGLLKQTSRYPTMAQVFVPHASTPEFWRERAEFRLMVAALPATGFGAAQLRGEIASIQARIVEANPKTHAGRTVVAVPLNERVTGTNDLAGSYARMLLAATGFVLLLACANVANLQLARVTGRAREFAIQSALGASRGRIAMQVVVECALLSLGGAFLGCFLAIWSVDYIKNLLPSELWIYAPMWRHVGLNWFALTVTMLLSVAAGVVTGVWPAWSSSRADAQESLREGGRAMSAGAGRQWFRGAMVAFQMSMALILLIGAGLMVRGTQVIFERFTAKQPEQVATGEMILPQSKYPEAKLRGEFIRKLESELESLPGRQEFGLVNYVPLSDGMAIRPVVIEGKPEPPPAERARVSNLIVSPGFFAAQRVALREGRLFTATDTAENDAVCVVDEKFAQGLLSSENVLGHRVALALDDERNWCRIVGVVAPNFQSPLDREPRRTLYLAMAQARPRTISVVLRTQAPMETMLPAVKRAILAADPEQPVRRLFSQEKLLELSVHGLKLVAIMMAGIGVIALVLSTVGVFSVVSYVVSERTSEIGMRMAMGATSRDIFALVSKQTLWMCGVGIAIGLAAGYALAQLFSGLIWGVSANDFWSLASVSLLLAMVGAIAMYLPARRAMRLDPMEALRHD
jgi:putative ABC transport system permease protein